MSAASKELPKGWEESYIGDIAEVLMGQSPPSSTYNQEQRGLPFFQGKTEFTDLHPVVSKWCSEPLRIAKKEDILLSVRAPVGSTNIADTQCCIGRGLASIRYHHCHKYLFYYFRSIERILDDQGTGTTFRAISGDIIKNTSCRFPPLAEQERIVAKIDELFSSLDKGIESIKTAQEQLKVYRQAVLKQAFEGKLTNKNVKDGELPKGWGINQLGEISTIYIGSTPSRNIPSYWGGSVNWVSSGEVRFSHIYETKEKITDDGYNNTSCKLHDPGTVVLAMIGEGKTRGQAAILEIPATHNQNTAAIELKNGHIPEYLYYYLMFTYQRNRQIGSGNNQKALNKERVKAFTIPLPPTSAEQVLIVSEIESRLSVCDKLEESIAQSLLQAEALRQSILKKAFEGKLVPQDPKDESASVLLERIRRERERTVPGKGRPVHSKSAIGPSKTNESAPRKRGRPRKEGLR